MPRILLVEDNQGDVDLILASCQEVLPNYAFTVVRTGAACRQLLKDDPSEPFDAIVLDYMLPDTDGISLLGSIVASGYAAAIIIVTMRNDAETAVAAMKAGASDYLVKSNDYWYHLPQVLKSAIERFRLARENQRLHHELAMYADRLEQAMYKARMEQRQLRAILNQLPEGVLIMQGSDGRIVAANQAAEQLWGHPFLLDEPMIEHWCHRVNHLNGQSVAPEETVLARVLQTGQPVLGEQRIIVQPDNKHLTVLINAAPLHNYATQNVYGAVMIFQDISEIKRLEDLKDEILTIASHELKNPLTVIMGYTALLARLPLFEHEGGARRAIQSIRQQSQRMRWLIERLLDLSRLDVGKMTLKCEWFDLTELMHTIAKQQQESTRRHNVQIQVQRAPLFIEGDLLRIEQVLTNLVNNAIKYSPDGGNIVLSLDRVDHKALPDQIVSALPPASKSFVCIQVRDYGIGIEQELQPHLFTRSYRTSEASHIASGQGLGLYLSAEIIRLHGGTLFVESTAGEGSTFSVVLPIEHRDDDENNGYHG